MATHSSVLAWRIPGTGEPGGLPSLGLHRVRHDWSDLAVAAAGYCFMVFWGFCFLFCSVLLRGIWDLSFQTRDQPTPSALECEVWTTGLPRKSLLVTIINMFFSDIFGERDREGRSRRKMRERRRVDSVVMLCELCCIFPCWLYNYTLFIGHLTKLHWVKNIIFSSMFKCCWNNLPILFSSLHFTQTMVCSLQTKRELCALDTLVSAQPSISRI